MKATSLFNGLSGVWVHSQALEGVADNLANLNTYGYKHSRSNFADMLSRTLGYGPGGTLHDPMQVGNGATVSMQTMMLQGSFEYTDSATDLAINGHGFFAVQYPDDDTTYYTRAGNFVVDKEGYLVNPTGHRLLGLGVDEQGNVTGTNLQVLQIPLNDAINHATTQVDLKINLDAGDSKENAQDTFIDPDDESTYNFAVTTTVYDDQGNAYTVVTFYQKLSSYSGASPTGSSQVWKAATFEVRGGRTVANPSEPDNTYYLHFDTNGHLVGISSGGSPAGDVWDIQGSAVSSSASEVSNRVGESFSYTGDGDQQTFLSTQSADMNHSWSAGDSLTITIGGAATTFDYATYSSVTSLAAAINQQLAASGLWVDYDASSDTLTFYGSGSNPAELSFSDSSVSITSTTLDDVVSAVDDGRSATGAMYLDLNDGVWAQGDSVTVGGNTYVWDDPATPGTPAGTTFSDLDDLVTLLRNDGYTARRIGTADTGSIFIQAASGSAGNSVSISSSTSGTFSSSGSLYGGMDGTSTTHVDASAVTIYDDNNQRLGTGLRLARDDTGTGATITIGGGTLGNNLSDPLDFSDATQVRSASGDPSSASADGQVQLTFQFQQTGDQGTTTISQQVTFDYDPDDSMGSTTEPYTGTTASAGASEIVYLDQDGYATGYLESVRVDRQGVVWGLYSNGEEIPLGAVGLTDFVSPEDLRREGDNLWLATDAAGDPQVGQPGSDIFGTIESGALEASTVDLSQEMVHMITYQRALQANARAITTSDEMIKTAINLKG